MLTSRVVTANRAAGRAPARTPARAHRASPPTRVSAAAGPPRAAPPTTPSDTPSTEATTPPARPSVAGPMPIVWISTEVAGWASTGGLGQVSAELPRELARRGHRVMTIAPRWDQYADAWDTAVSVDVGGETVRFFHTKRSGVDHVWVDSPIFLERVWGKTGSKLYGPTSGTDYPDSHAAFALFCRAALAAINSLPFSPASGAPGARQPFAIVANDWHAALVPVLIKDEEVPAGRFTNARTVLVAHNASFQGRAPAPYFSATGLPQSSFDRFAFEDGDPRAPGGPDPGPTPPRRALRQGQLAESGRERGRSRGHGVARVRCRTHVRPQGRCRTGRRVPGGGRGGDRERSRHGGVVAVDIPPHRATTRRA